MNGQVGGKFPSVPGCRSILIIARVGRTHLETQCLLRWTGTLQGTTVLKQILIKRPSSVAPIGTAP